MGTPVPLLHTRGPAVSKAAPFSGGVVPQGAATHLQSTKRLWQHRVQGRPGRHICQHLHHITLWSTAWLWVLGAGWHPQPSLPCARFLPALAKGVSQRSTCPAVTRTKSRSSTSSSPGQAARRISVYWFT